MRPIFRTIALAALSLAGCQRHVDAPRLAPSQVDAVERAVTYCTVATAGLGGRRGKSEARDAAATARARCASARATITPLVRLAPPLVECLRDVEAQQHIAEIRLASLDNATSQTRSALVAALDEAASRQGHCSANLARAG